MNPAEDTKARSLTSHGALHPHPGRVRDGLFQGSAFFDLRDLVQVRYEMLRRHLVDGQPVARVARTFGMSRQMFYLLARALRRRGSPACCRGSAGRGAGPRKATVRGARLCRRPARSSRSVDPRTGRRGASRVRRAVAPANPGAGAGTPGKTTPALGDPLAPALHRPDLAERD